MNYENLLKKEKLTKLKLELQNLKHEKQELEMKNQEK